MVGQGSIRQEGCQRKGSGAAVGNFCSLDSEPCGSKVTKRELKMNNKNKNGNNNKIKKQKDCRFYSGTFSRPPPSGKAVCGSKYQGQCSHQTTQTSSSMTARSFWGNEGKRCLKTIAITKSSVMFTKHSLIRQLNQ